MTVKPFRVSLVEPVAYLRDSYAELANQGRSYLYSVLDDLGLTFLDPAK